MEEEKTELYILPLTPMPESLQRELEARQREEEERERYFAVKKQELESAQREQAETQRKEEEARQKALRSPWTYILATLVVIANILFFIPMLLLTFLGLSQHPFIGNLFFRDFMRGR